MYLQKKTPTHETRRLASVGPGVKAIYENRSMGNFRIYIFTCIE